MGCITGGGRSNIIELNGKLVVEDNSIVLQQSGSARVTRMHFGWSPIRYVRPCDRAGVIFPLMWWRCTKLMCRNMSVIVVVLVEEVEVAQL